MKAFMSICPQLVQKLGVVKAELKSLKKDEAKMVEVAKETFTEVKVSKSRVKDEYGKIKKTLTYKPKGIEYYAVLSEFQQADVSWKDEFEKLYTKLNGKSAYKRFVKKLPTKPCTQLDIYEK